MGTPLMIGPTEKAALAALREDAAAHPVDMPALMKAIKTPAGKRTHKARMTRQTVEIPMAYLVTFSIEVGHPSGTFRHMSLSVQREGRIPNEHAVWMVAQELGFVGGLGLCTAYLEDLAGHGKAINVLQPVGMMPSADAPTTGSLM